MQIVEVKNEIAKIIYNPADNHLLPSDFLLVEDVNQKLIAQVLSIETTEETDKNLAILRLSLSIDFEDNLSYYNGYIPSKDANLIYINPDEIIELIRGNDLSLYFGNLSNRNSCFVHTNISLIDDKAYILSDRADATKMLSQNLIAELHSKRKKVIILDFNGQYASFTNVERLKYSKNIKLPLDIDAFDTILENDIVDCPLEDKAVIQSIVLELREYMNTLEDKYIPFNMFKNVVDTEFVASPISGLMLLRNKLWMYAQSGLFADYKNEFDVINSSLEENPILIIDASDVEEKWFKFILKTVVELTSEDCYLFISLNDLKLDRKAIVNLYNKQNIIPVPSTTYDSPYKNILNSLTKNFIFCKPSSFIQDNEPYVILLNRMNNNEFILYGETTLYLPILVELKLFDTQTKEEVVQNDVKKDVDKLLSSPHSILPKTANIINEIMQDEEVNDEELISSIPEDTLTDSDFDYLDEISSSNDKKEEEIKVQKTISEEVLEESADEITSDIEEPYGIFNPELPEQKQLEEVKQEINNIVALSEDDLDILNEPFVPLLEESSALDSNDSAQFNDLLANTPSQPIEKIQSLEETNINISEESEEKIVDNYVQDDISETLEKEELETIQPQEDEVLDDLNPIKQNAPEEVLESVKNEKLEQQNTEEKELVIEFEDDEEEENTPPPVSKEVVRKKPEVPVYETVNKKGVDINDVPFKVGDRVYHPKNGKGTIIEFANYSNKILFFQIDFDNVGRRILDPRISGIEKIVE